MPSASVHQRLLKAAQGAGLTLTRGRRSAGWWLLRRGARSCWSV